MLCDSRATGLLHRGRAIQHALRSLRPREGVGGLVCSTTIGSEAGGPPADAHSRIASFRSPEGRYVMADRVSHQ